MTEGVIYLMDGDGDPVEVFKSHVDPKGNPGEQGTYKIPVSMKQEPSTTNGFVQSFHLVYDQDFYARIAWKKMMGEATRYFTQLEMMACTPGHFAAVRRCIKYGNRIPRKYRRKYPLVIKALMMVKGDLPDKLII